MKKKICFVATTDVAVTSFLANHLRELVKFYDLTIITNARNSDFLSGHSIDAKLIQLKFTRKIDLFSDFYCLAKLIQFFISNKFSAIHSITPKAGLLAMLAARLCFVKVRVHSFTGQVWVSKTGLKQTLLKSLDKLLGLLTTHNIVDSQSQRDFLIQQKILTYRKSIVFGSGSVSGVDLKRFKANKQMSTKIRVGLSIPKGAFIFIYLGRLNRDKGVLDLASAFAEIQNKKAFLLVVGPDEGNFVDRIKKINVHKINQLRFIGFMNRPEYYLAASDALCLPSYREGFGNVIIEAAASQIPAIASNIYGISDAIINHQTGILHPVEDVNAIVSAMQYFLNKPHMAIKFGKAARKRAIAKFDSQKITYFWIEFYSSILNDAQQKYI
jgi:glycosyltransferase involved in cell wall biosynthesis